MLYYVDTHAHLEDEQFDEDREALIASFPREGVLGVVNVGASLEGARAAAELSERYERVFMGAGIHPDDVGCMNDEVMDELTAMCRREKCVCVGEIGLDYHWNVEEKAVQKRWFAEQMHLAIRENLPINVHSRDAAQDTYDLIKAEHAGATGGIIHCFSGSAELAQLYVRMGYMIGIGGVVTFKNAKTLVKVVQQVPLENLVTETDSPYLAPVPHRGQRNNSTYIPLVIEKIAQIKGVEPGYAAKVLLENACRVYPKMKLPEIGQFE